MWDELSVMGKAQEESGEEGGIQRNLMVSQCALDLHFRGD